MSPRLSSLFTCVVIVLIGVVPLACVTVITIGVVVVSAGIVVVSVGVVVVSPSLVVVSQGIVCLLYTSPSPRDS